MQNLLQKTKKNTTCITLLKKTIPLCMLMSDLTHTISLACKMHSVIKPIENALYKLRLPLPLPTPKKWIITIR